MRSAQVQIIPRSTDYGRSSQLQRSNSDDQYHAHAASKFYEPKTPIDPINVPRYDLNTRNGNLDSIAPLQPQQFFSSDAHSRSNTMPGPGSWRSFPTSYTSSTAQHTSFPAHLPDGHGSMGYIRHQDFPPMLPLPPPGYPAASQNTVPADRSSYAAANHPQPSIETHPTADMTSTNGFDQVPPDLQTGPYSTQGFEAEAHDLYPYTLPEDFTTWLFNDPQLSLYPPDGQRQGSMSLGATAFMDESVNVSRTTHGSHDDIMNDQFDRLVPQHPMSVTSIVDPAQTEAILSEEKWQQLLELIEVRFNETDDAAQKQKDELLLGYREDSCHVLSLPMIQTYIRSYWDHFHPQMPILHKPTFSADKAQNLLLVAIIAIGASCLDKLHGHQVTQAGADLSSFLASHLRYEIFKDKAFIAPAKLWVLQALVLLEIYEKMYSTRLLHERAHIHHATTLTLMRRGSS